jgi:UDP-glucose 4-epimerase
VSSARKIVVTGGAGFIGSHVVERWQGRAEIVVLDNLRTGHRRNLDGLQVRFLEGSILDRALVREAVRDAEYIFHLAALISVPESMERPRECAEINVLGLLNVLEEAAQAGVRKLCLASSAAVYGDDPVVPKTEEMAPQPRSPYALTKLDGEFYCRLFTETGHLPCVAYRFFNVFGPRQDPHSAYAAAVPAFLARAQNGEPLTVFGDGEQTRDFVYVKDIAAALEFGAVTPEITGVFNVGYGTPTTINTLVRTICDATGTHPPVHHAPPRAGDVRHSVASAEKLRRAGFTPGWTLESGLLETVALARPARPAGA